jgi:hypothetical protein
MAWVSPLPGHGNIGHFFERQHRLAVFCRSLFRLVRYTGLLDEERGHKNAQAPVAAMLRSSFPASRGIRVGADCARGRRGSARRRRSISDDRSLSPRQRLARPCASG